MIPTSSARSLDLITHSNKVHLLSVTMTPSNGLRQSPENRMDMTEKHGRSFAGKVALVTGGSRGIVRRLALDGAAVAFTYCKMSSLWETDCAHNTPWLF